VKPYEVIAATRGSALTPTQRHVLTHVSMRAGVDGECFASVCTLSEDTGYGERAIQGALRELVRLEVLLERRSPGRTTTYRIQGDRIPPGHPRSSCAPPPQQVPPAPDAPQHVVHPTPATGAGGPQHVVHPTPAPRAPDPIQDPIHRSDPGERERGRATPPPGHRTEKEPAIDLGAAAAVLAAIRGRPVRELEARREAHLVAAVLELDPERGLPLLEQEALLVAHWAAESPQGRDELGGIRQSTGLPWGPDRSRRPAVVLDLDRWPDWLDSARRWASGAAPPGGRGGREDPRRRLTPDEEAEGREALEWLKARGIAS
jgi:hypothetical protein